MALPLQIEPVRPIERPRLVLVQGGRSLPPRRSVYRRRRVVAALALLLVIGALALAGHAGSAVLGGVPASAPEPRPVAELSADGFPVFGGQELRPGGLYVVQPGDTLWALARALQPEGDVSGLVRTLVRLHGGAELAVGDRVPLPA